MALLIFDLDGTLLDSRESILESIHFAFNKIGRAVRVDSKDAVRQDLWTTLRQTEEKYGTEFSAKEKQTFIDQYRQHNTFIAAEKIRPYDGVEDTLGKLEDDFALAVATTKHSYQAIHILERMKMARFFAHIQGTDPGLRYKPAPDILLKVSETLKISGHRSAYTGDSPHDLQAAHASEMLVLGAAYGYSDPEELQNENPHWLLRQFRELMDLKEKILESFSKRAEKPEAI